MIFGTEESDKIPGTSVEIDVERNGRRNRYGRSLRNSPWESFVRS